MHASPATVAACWVALFTAHQLGDHWLQTHRQATAKGGPGWPGRAACAAHVATLSAAKALAVGAVAAVCGLALSPAAVAVALAIDAASHYWADRRTTLAKLAELSGHAEFYRLGVPREGRDDNPSLGTGAYALDQSWHAGWLAVAALIAGTPL